jgi:hypothetical protein
MKIGFILADADVTGKLAARGFDDGRNGVVACWPTSPKSL